MEKTKTQSQQAQGTWFRSRRLQRFLYLMSPDGQLSSHPVMGMLWIVAVGCAVGGILLALLGRRGWSPLLVCAAILGFNMVLGSIGQMIFEELPGHGLELGPEGNEPDSPNRPGFPPDGTSPIQPDTGPGKVEIKLPGREQNQNNFHQQEWTGGEELDVNEEMIVTTVSSRMLVAFAKSLPRVHDSGQSWARTTGCTTQPKQTD